jgi:WD40 repeat protein
MAQDGSFALSVGTDKKILIFDIRVQNAVGSMDASNMAEMHDLALSSSASFDSNHNNVSSVGGAPNSWQTPKMDMNGFVSVGHLDGSLSIWNINMRQCFA